MAKRYTIQKITQKKKKAALVKELFRELRAVDRRELQAGVKEMKALAVECAALDMSETKELSAWAKRGASIENEIHDSVFLAEECFAAYEGTGLVATWGYRAVEGYEGRLVWCLGTERVAKNRYAFAVESKRILTDWKERFGVLYNAVGAFNKDALHWLGFCGASFHEEITIGGERFIPFTLERGQ